MGFRRALERVIGTVRIACARLRSYLLAFRGVAIAGKGLVGPRVRVDRPWNVRMGRRCVLEPDVWLEIGQDGGTVVFGDHVFVGRGAHLMINERLEVGSGVMIGDGVLIADHKHPNSLGVPIAEQGTVSDPIRIGDDVDICVRAVILQGVTIGDGAVIGPGAIVTGDVPPNRIVSGMPARVVGERK